MRGSNTPCRSKLQTGSIIKPKRSIVSFQTSKMCSSNSVGMGTKKGKAMAILCILYPIFIWGGPRPKAAFSSTTVKVVSQMLALTLSHPIHLYTCNGEEPFQNSWIR